MYSRTLALEYDLKEFEFGAHRKTEILKLERAICIQIFRLFDGNNRLYRVQVEEIGDLRIKKTYKEHNSTVEKNFRTCILVLIYHKKNFAREIV